MYVSPEDLKIIRSDEVQELRKRYHAKFGVHFPPFNYEDFLRTKTVSAGDVYRKLLLESLEADEPFDQKAYWTEAMNCWLNSLKNQQDT